MTLTSLTDVIAGHAWLAYSAVFILAFMEAVPIIGAVVPGTVFIVGIAALVPTGSVKLWPLVATAVIGGIAGDGFSFWLGQHYREAVLKLWPFNRYPDFVERGRAFIDRHGGKSIFVARFTWARAFVPIIVGMLHMPAGRFYLANVVSALIWAAGLILPGILLGVSLAHAGAATSRVVILLGVMLGLVWLVVAALRLAFRRGVPLIEATAEAIRRWSAGRDTWLARQVAALIDPGRREARALLLWSVLVLAATWLFLGLLEAVVNGEPLVQLDTIIYATLQGLRTEAGDAVMIALSELGDPAVSICVTTAVALFLATQRAWRSAAYWVAAVAFAALLNAVARIAVQRPGPMTMTHDVVIPFSFPSGHATVNAVIYGFLAFLLTRRLRPVWRVPVFAAALSLAALIAFSRLYLGARWFSDVVAGLAFATAWSVGFGIAYTHHLEDRFNRGALAAVAGTALLLAGGIDIAYSHRADARLYAVRYTPPEMTPAAWRDGGWRRLPARRITLIGEQAEPLTLQWAGSLDGLERRLTAAGWHRPPPWNLGGTLAWLVTADPLKLPVVATLDAGRLPALTLTEPDPGRPAARLVVRVWPVDFRLRHDGTEPLWVGSVVEERLSRPFSLMTLPTAGIDIVQPRRILAQALGNGILVRRDYQSRGWDGQLLLAGDALPPAAPP